MMITAAGAHPSVIKTRDEIECIARAGAIVERGIDAAVRACEAGATTAFLDEIVRRIIDDAGADSLFRGRVEGDAPPFPGAACVSVNDAIVHGVPGDRVLAMGDVVSIDVGARLDGWCADGATTVIVGGVRRAIDPRHAGMVRALRDCLDGAIGSIRPGVPWSRIAGRIERGAQAGGFGIVTEYIGHGVGRELHEWPRVPGYSTGFRGDDFVLEEGMVLAIEPIFTALPPARPRGQGLPGNACRVYLCQDGWTVATVDGSWAAHEERTVAVTASGARHLTEFKLAGA